VVDRTDEPAKVTLAHLTRAERICARRLAREHVSSRANSGATVRWQISNRVLQDVRLAHTELAEPGVERFRAGTDLTPEQSSVYELASRWYVTLFEGRAVRTVDEDEWGTDRDDGIRLVGPAGLGVADADDHAEIRILRFANGGVVPDDLTTAPAVRFALLRRPDWLDGRPVRVAVADLVLGIHADTVVDTARELPVLEAWLKDRVAVIRQRVVDPVPVPGIECGWCPFIANCGPHRQ
jgi:hypothetical protein